MSNHSQYSSNAQYPYGQRPQQRHPQQYAGQYYPPGVYPGMQPGVPPPAQHGQYRSGPYPDAGGWGPQPPYDPRDQRGDLRSMEEYAPYGPQSQNPLQNMRPNRGGAPPPPPQQQQPPPQHQQQPPPGPGQPYDYRPQKYEYEYAAPSRSSNSPMPPQQPPPPPQAPQFDEPNSRRRAEHAFNYFDKDQSGYLDFQEFQEALRYLNLAIGVGDAKRHFYGADLDGNQQISKREFVDMYIRERRSFYQQYNGYQQNLSLM